jgi:hypothetical protein
VNAEIEVVGEKQQYIDESASDFANAILVRIYFRITGSG